MQFIDFTIEELEEHPSVLLQYDNIRPIGKMYNTVVNPATKRLFIRIKPSIKQLSTNTYRLSAGVDSKELPKISDIAKIAFYSLDYVPGTVGGMIYQNASSATSISQYIKDVCFILINPSMDAKKSTPKIMHFNKKECKFGYRNSIFRELSENGNTVVILYADFELPSAPPVITPGQIQKFERKLGIWKRCESQLRDYDPLGCKGCIYRDLYVKQHLPQEVVQHNILMTSYGRSFWIPSKDVTFEDWIANIKECEEIIKLETGKEPNHEIEIIY